MKTRTGFVQNAIFGSLLIVMPLLHGCAEDPPCGVDDEDNPIPECLWTSENADEELLFCPGDHFAADDGCQSCGCGAGGEVICTEAVCN